MAFPVAKSDTALVFDTLPALKVRYFRTYHPRENVYTYGQMYALPAGLAVALHTFELVPSAGSEIVLLLGAPDHPLLRFTLKPAGATLHLLGNGTATPLPSPEITPFSDNAEQGDYWGAQFILPAGVLQKAGCTLGEGSIFRAAVCKAFDGRLVGASCPLPFEEARLTQNMLEECIVMAF